MNTKIISLSLLCASLSLQAVQAAHNDAALRSLRAQLDQEVEQVASAKTSSNNFTLYSDNDIALTLKGEMRGEYVRQHQTESFNRKLQDEFGYFSNRVELDLNVAQGAERYGKPAVEAGVKIRHKHKGGQFDVLKAGATKFKVGDAVQSVDAASINHPLGWFKHLWLKVSLNALTGRNAETDHFVRAGLFDWQAGRGIAYGSLYGTQKKHLGVFNAMNDFAPYGINLAGDLLKDRVGYDLYFGRLEEKSASFEQTNNREMAHLVGRRANPESGVGKSNDVFGARLKFHYDTLSVGDITNEYYIVYNAASNQQVEVANDSRTRLGSFGSMLEYQSGNFEFGYEWALNFGHQDVFAIDRNVIALNNTTLPLAGVVDVEGTDYSLTTQVQTMAPTYSKVTVNDTTGVINSGVKSLVDGYDSNFGGVTLGTTTIGANTVNVKNATDRYRNAYRVDFSGWMAVADMTYNWKRANVKFNAALGHASGDTNPHDADTPSRKTYHGFVGLNENYAGKRVKSVLVLNARKAQRPSVNDNGAVLIDNSFTDMTFAGAGLEWRLPRKDVEIGTNVMWFFKDHEGNKYVYDPINDTGAASGEKADRFLGTEANMTFNWKLLPGLALAGEAAVFVPGTYYEHIKGTPLPSKMIVLLDADDKSGYVQKSPRMSTDTAYHLSIGVQYKF